MTTASTHARDGAGARRSIATAERRLLPRATVAETLAVAGRVLLPALAQGVIIRRPWMVALAARLDLDGQAVRCLRRLAGAHRGPLLIGPILGRRWAVVLTPEDAHRVLRASPAPFSPASAEKIAALSHFEPRNVLISQGAARTERRAFHEAVLQTDRPVHALAGSFDDVVGQEISALSNLVGSRRALTWPTFAAAWSRIVRRVVFGDAARDDEALTDELARLRARANWSFLWPVDRALRQRFLRRVDALTARAGPDSLAAMVAAHVTSSTVAPAEQVPQWLFAFDAAGIATFRAAVLIATQPAKAARAQEECRAHGAGANRLPFLRACLLEAVRLWPTTPLILRQSTEDTAWDDGVMPAQTGVLIHAPFFDRDDRRLPFAHRFTPEVWLRAERPEDAYALMPFSDGPVRCPGRSIVEQVGSAFLATLFETQQVSADAPALRSGRDLPGTLNHFALALHLRRA